MSADNLERRVKKLEQQDTPGIRGVLVHPREQLVVLRAADMGEPDGE